MTDILFLFVTDGAEYHSGIAGLSAEMKARGFTTALCMLDIRRGRDTMISDLREALTRESPRLIAASAMSCHWPDTRQALALCKELSEAPVVVGGWHATLEPEEVALDPSVDFCCVGEGEGPLLELVTAIAENGDRARFSGIPNLWVRDETGTVRRNALRPPVEDLDTYPLPDRELFPYRDMLERNAMSILGPAGPPRMAPLVAGRGCPYRCTYCSNDAWMKRYGLPPKAFLRRRRVERVAEELEYLSGHYDPSWFEFWDEDFTVDRDWLETFSGMYPDVTNRPFSVLARPNNVQGDEFQMLSRAGCRLVFMGIESGNEHYRRTYLKRQVSDDQIVQAFARARAADVPTVSLNMIGLPWETPEQIEDTIALNERIQPDFFLCFVYIPFPNTELYLKAEASGLIKPSAAVNYGGNSGANVDGIDDDTFRRLLERVKELQDRLDTARTIRYPGLFSAA